MTGYTLDMFLIQRENFGLVLLPYLVLTEMLRRCILLVGEQRKPWTFGPSKCRKNGPCAACCRLKARILGTLEQPTTLSSPEGPRAGCHPNSQSSLQPEPKRIESPRGPNVALLRPLWSLCQVEPPSSRATLGRPTTTEAEDPAKSDCWYPPQ